MANGLNDDLGDGEFLPHYRTAIISRRFPWPETHPAFRGGILCFFREIREWQDRFWGEFLARHPPLALCSSSAHKSLPGRPDPLHGRLLGLSPRPLTPT